jgi:sugar phosphate isomerase/epimerase
MERYARDGVEWDWERIYGDCAEAGVDAVETDPLPEKVRILDRLGLRVSSSYLGLPLDAPLPDELMRDRVQAVATRLADAGGTTLVLNADPPGLDDPAAAARAVGDNLRRVADVADRHGLRLVLHNHADEPVRASVERAAVLEHADQRAGFCLDTGWAVVAGDDPVARAREHGDRIGALHLRTVGADGVPAEDLSSGRPSMPDLLDALPDFDGWLILELWHPPQLMPAGSMLEANRRSVQLLRGLLGPDLLA